jgi:hypothetical protein
MPAGLIIAGVAAAATVGGAVISSNASKNATKEATRSAQQATDKNIALETQIRDENRGILSPFVQQGTQANGALNALMYGNDGGASLKALQEAPGYQFRVQQGQNALNTGWAARGLLNSGAAQKAAISFGQNIASEEYGNRYGQLAQQQGVGLAAGNALAGVGTNFANNVTSQNNSLANVQANAALARGQATGQMWGTIGNAVGQFGGQMVSSYKPPQPISAYGR